ncbi:MAG TPA: sugar ABC transporter permease [Trebonia sp.]|jgi:multiple sugar transport system permease protein|nr:sugar ABC transporter permease [Trebonia sp.]
MAARTLGTRRFGTPARRRLRTGLLFVSPWIVGFLAFTLYPFLMTFFYSFTNYDIVSNAQWVGLGNYDHLIHDGLFWTALWNTGFYTVLEVPLSTVVAIALAMLLNMKVRGLAVYRTIFYLPTVVPIVASSILWLWLFNPSFGIINDLLTDVHVAGPGWMFSTLWAKPTFVLLGIWGSGAPMVVYLAALQGVPKEMYEVAQIEGANAWHRIRYVMLPMISPAILFNVILALVACLQYFTQAYIMTQGGPDNSTLFYSLYLYQQAFQDLHLGYASAMAWILFVIVLVITLLLFRSSSRWVYYAGED